MNKEGESESLRQIDMAVRTVITHNKGSKWELIKPPTEDSQGRKTNCYLEDGCSLNLQIYSSNGLFAPPYSQESAVGVILAVGNLGDQLERNKV